MKTPRSVIAIAILAVALVGVAFYIFYSIHYLEKMPIQLEEKRVLCTYTQTPSYNYLAHIEPNALYNETVIGKDKIFYTKFTKAIDVEFQYVFDATVEGNIAATYTVESRLEELSKDKWVKMLNVPVSVETRENATTFVLTARVSYNITEIKLLAEKIKEAIGAYQMGYMVVFDTRVEIVDQTSVGTIRDSLNSAIELQFIFLATGNKIEVNASSVPKQGSIEEPYFVPNTKRINLERVMTYLLIAAVLLAGIAVSVYWVHKRKFDKLPEAEKIIQEHKVFEAEMPDLKKMKEKTIEGLIETAEKNDSPIHHTIKNGKDIFFVVGMSERIVYTYEPAKKNNNGQKKNSQSKNNSRSSNAGNNKKKLNKT